MAPSSKLHCMSNGMTLHPIPVNLWELACGVSVGATTAASTPLCAL